MWPATQPQDHSLEKKIYGQRKRMKGDELRNRMIGRKKGKMSVSLVWVWVWVCGCVGVGVGVGVWVCRCVYGCGCGWVCLLPL